MSSKARGDTALGALNFFIDDKRIPLTEHKTGAIAAEVGRTYQVLASDAGMDDAQSPLAKDVVVLREGQDLVLIYPDGVRVVIENYFEVCQFGRCEVLLPELRYSREDAERVSLDESVSLFALDGVPAKKLQWTVPRSR